MPATDRQKQIAEAEELLSDRTAAVGFAKGLYFGRWLGEKLPPYPDFGHDTETTRRADELRQFCRDQIDPVAIDRDALIPQHVIDGLGKLGTLGACVPTECGGLGLSQTSYCRL